MNTRFIYGSLPPAGGGSGGKVITFKDQRACKKVPVLGEDGKPTTEVAGIVYLTGKEIVVLGCKSVYPR